MRYMLLWFFIFCSLYIVSGQKIDPLETVVITSENTETRVFTAENGVLYVNISPEDVRRFKALGLVSYSDFGARGDGKTDDIDAIAAAHAFANRHNLNVKADEEGTYYIGGKKRTAVIKTNTDFGMATFIIDDREVQDRNSSVFLVNSSLQPLQLEGITSLKRNQEKIDLSLPSSCLVIVTNSQIRHYIRFGPNQNNGSPQTDIFIVGSDGNLDKNTPIIWDFDEITNITAHPIDASLLTITGGRFTTIANREESKYNYYRRGILIRRSNVVLES
ncbi:MAG: hypothetical protein OEM26_21990, partial [Saprospiraceae bacterium]|nr:hypothetical protein [Saprospiraceae bacterium]